MGEEISEDIKEMMCAGAYFYKHDFGRSKRSRKHVILSQDGKKISWKAVGATEGVGASPGGGSSARGMLRSASFSRQSSIDMADVSHIIYGPYTDTFAKKTAHDRTDARWLCFSLVLRESRTVDFAIEDETVLLPWLLGFQTLIVMHSKTSLSPSDRWTLPKLHLQKLRLKISGESDRTGQGPYDVLISAVLDVAKGLQVTSDQATVLQAAWRRRNTQGRFQVLVQQKMEIEGLIEELEVREQEVAAKQEQTAAQLEAAMKKGGGEDAPPAMPSDKDMADPKKMQDYMLEMGVYSARQQLRIQAMEETVSANQSASQELNDLNSEKRKLQNLADKLTFSISASQMENLSDAEKAKVQEIQNSLGVTPRGSIRSDGVRKVTLVKENQQTRLGIIFHQNTPNELTNSDMTPRGHTGAAPVVLPIIKVLDKSGIAGNTPGLYEGDQLISVNGKAALSNIQAVQMLREAMGEVVLAVRETKISKTPRGTESRVPASPYSSGLRPINQQ